MENLIAIGAFVALLAAFSGIAALFGAESREGFAPYRAGA
jgi:hypothetical protein